MEQPPASKDHTFIICVDDEQAILNQISTQLEDAFGDICTVENAESAEEALAMMDDLTASGDHIQLVISDQVMPGMKGAEFLEIVNQRYPKTNKILLTGYAGLESAMYAINYAGLDKYIEKPWDKDDFLDTVRHLLLPRPSDQSDMDTGFRVREALQNVLIFRDLDLQEIDLIADKLQLIQYAKDTVIFNIDDPGDCMYIIKSGEIRVVAGVGNSGEVLAYLGRGNYFGEMALLTGEPRSASVVTAMDSEIFVLTKQDFDDLLERHPSIALALSHVLSQRLRKISIQKAGRQNKIISILNTLQKSRQKPLILEIARKLMKETNGEVVVIDIDVSQEHIAFLLDLEREPKSSRWIIEHLDQVKQEELSHLLPADRTGVRFFILPPQDEFPLHRYFVQLLSVLKEFYTFVLVNLMADEAGTPDGARIMEQASTILYLAEQGTAEDARTLQHLTAFQDEWPHLQPKLEVVIVREKKHQPAPQALYNYVQRQHIHFLRLDEDPVQFLFHDKGSALVTSGDQPQPQIKRDVSRIARRLGNVSIGLVLGGGGARAYAHLGILKVLQEANIPVDMIAGTSMGAFLGALHVMGKSNAEILELSLDAWGKLLSPLSWTLPRVSFIKGRRIRQVVHHIFGDTLIEDLPIPFFCVAGDLVSGQEVVMGQGYLYEAILASGALPAFFAPVQINGMQLVDGGVVNNVPGDVLKKQGIDIVIAVDVTPEREVHLQSDKDNRQYQGNPLRRLWQYGRHLRTRYGTILLPRIIMRVIAIEGLEITRNKSRYFDIHIKPNLEDFDLFDFTQLEEIVRLGEETGREQLAKIRETLNALKH